MNQLFTDNAESPAVIRKIKRRLGLWYGVLSGFAFAFAAWGWDAYLLSRFHAYLPWLQFIVALALCGLFGGLTSLLVAYIDKGSWVFIFWLPLALGLAWLTLALPLQIFPALLAWLNPQAAAQLDYAAENYFSLRFGVLLLWTLPLTLAAGVVQVLGINASIFARSLFGKAMPFLVGSALLLVSGGTSDTIVNAYFRDAVTSLDKTVQFALDNAENPNITKEQRREMHIGALSLVRQDLSPARSFLIRSYDSTFQEVQILAIFENARAECTVWYGQPSFCKPLP